jgi:hypothetical protein
LNVLKNQTEQSGESGDNGQQELESPSTMTDAEIEQELARLGEPKEGVVELGVLDSRRDDLKAEQQKRKDELQEMQARYPVGTEVNDKNEGHGVVVRIGGTTFTNTLAVQFDNGEFRHYFSLDSAEDNLSIIDVPIEGLGNGQPETVEETVEDNGDQEYDEEYEEDEESDEEEDDESGVMARNRKIAGNSSSGPRTDAQTVDELYESEDRLNPIKEQEQRCKKP